MTSCHGMIPLPLKHFKALEKQKTKSQCKKRLFRSLPFSRRSPHLWGYLLRLQLEERHLLLLCGTVIKSWDMGDGGDAKLKQRSIRLNATSSPEAFEIISSFLNWSWLRLAEDLAKSHFLWTSILHNLENSIHSSRRKGLTNIGGVFLTVLSWPNPKPTPQKKMPSSSWDSPASQSQHSQHPKSPSTAARHHPRTPPRLSSFEDQNPRALRRWFNVSKVKRSLLPKCLLNKRLTLPSPQASKWLHFQKIRR